jgi:hypothetical protein
MRRPCNEKLGVPSWVDIPAGVFDSLCDILEGDDVYFSKMRHRVRNDVQAATWSMPYFPFIGI